MGLNINAACIAFATLEHCNIVMDKRILGPSANNDIISC